MNIKILGGGVGGLATAIALRQKGFQVQVFERHAGRSDIGAGIVCWPNASFVLDELGVLNEIADCSGNLQSMTRYSDNKLFLGSLDISQLNKYMNYPSYSILRKDLMKILECRLEELGVKINYNHNIVKLVASSDGVAFQLENGVVETADIIIAADGRMRSIARKFVNGNNEPVYQRFINWVGTVNTRETLFSDISVDDYWGVGKRFGIVPVSSTSAYWGAGVAATRLGENKPSEYKEELFNLFENWPAPIRTIIKKSSITDINKIYVHDHNPMPVWHKDNLLVIGDAAHAALPTSGQGACQALEDAWHLARLLEQYDGDLQAIFYDFTKLRSPKTNNIIMSGRQLASSLFNTDPDFCSQRNLESQKTDFTALAKGMAQAWSSQLPIGM